MDRVEWFYRWENLRKSNLSILDFGSIERTIGDGFSFCGNHMSNEEVYSQAQVWD